MFYQEDWSVLLFVCSAASTGPLSKTVHGCEDVTVTSLSGKKAQEHQSPTSPWDTQPGTVGAGHEIYPQGLFMQCSSPPHPTCRTHGGGGGGSWWPRSDQIPNELFSSGHRISATCTPWLTALQWTTFLLSSLVTYNLPQLQHHQAAWLVLFLSSPRCFSYCSPCLFK